jgi:hypothetical protein
MEPYIIRVKPLNDFKIELEYETGEVKIFDVSPYIRGAWYGELGDATYFKSVRVTDDKVCVEWANGQDIAPDELYGRSALMNKTNS